MKTKQKRLNLLSCTVFVEIRDCSLSLFLAYLAGEYVLKIHEEIVLNLHFYYTRKIIFDKPFLVILCVLLRYLKSN